MDCQCESKLQLLLAEVKSNDELMADAATEGPYWERMVASGFIKRLCEQQEPVGCECPTAQRINTAFTYIRDPSVSAAVAHSGGGTMEERLAQNFSYAEFKSLLICETLEIKPVIAL